MPSSSKPLEAEELIDEHLHRPLARQIIPGLARTSITPNQVTFLSGLVGVIGGILLGASAQRPVLRLWAGVLLFISVVLDCCDGQLARIRGISSTTGAVVDGLADYVVGCAMGIGASWYLVTMHNNPWYWLVGLVGVASAAAQSWFFDHSKTRYIARCRTGYAEREEDLGAIANQRREAWQSGRYWDALLLFGYLNYSRAQNAALSIAATEDPIAFRAKNAGRMRAWTFLGTGTHFAMAYLACFAAFWWPGAILAFWVLHIIPFNLYLLALILLEPRAQAA